MNSKAYRLLIFVRILDLVSKGWWNVFKQMSANGQYGPDGWHPVLPIRFSPRTSVSQRKQSLVFDASAAGMDQLLSFGNDRFTDWIFALSRCGLIAVIHF